MKPKQFTKSVMQDYDKFSKSINNRNLNGNQVIKELFEGVGNSIFFLEGRVQALIAQFDNPELRAALRQHWDSYIYANRITQSSLLNSPESDEAGESVLLDFPEDIN